jgi:hypothetical protein
MYHSTRHNMLLQHFLKWKLFREGIRIGYLRTLISESQIRMATFWLLVSLSVLSSRYWIISLNNWDFFFWIVFEDPSLIIGYCSLFQKPIKVKGKAIPVTGCGGPKCCGRSRLPYSRQSAQRWPEVVTLTRRPPFTPQEDSRYSLLLEAESTSGP